MEERIRSSEQKVYERFIKKLRDSEDRLIAQMEELKGSVMGEVELCNIEAASWQAKLETAIAKVERK